MRDLATLVSGSARSPSCSARSALGALGRDQVRPADAGHGAAGRRAAGRSVTRLWLLGLPVARGGPGPGPPDRRYDGGRGPGLVDGRPGQRRRRRGPAAARAEPLRRRTTAEWWLASDLTHTGRPLRHRPRAGRRRRLDHAGPLDPAAAVADGPRHRHRLRHPGVPPGDARGAVTATDTVAALPAGDPAQRRGSTRRPRAAVRRAHARPARRQPARAGRAASGSTWSSPTRRTSITPRGSAGAPRVTYRDGGLVGDQVVQRLVEGVGAVADRRRHRSAARQLGAPSRRGLARPGRRLARRQRPARLGGRSARCRTRPSTPRPGLGTAGTRRAPPSTTRVRRLAGRLRAARVEAVGFGVVTLRRPATAPAACVGASTAAGCGGSQELRRPDRRTRWRGCRRRRVLAAEEWLLGVSDRGPGGGPAGVADDVDRGAVRPTRRRGPAGRSG